MSRARSVKTVKAISPTWTRRKSGEKTFLFEQKKQADRQVGKQGKGPRRTAPIACRPATFTHTSLLSSYIPTLSTLLRTYSSSKHGRCPTSRHLGEFLLREANHAVMVHKSAKEQARAYHGHTAELPAPEVEDFGQRDRCYRGAG